MLAFIRYLMVFLLGGIAGAVAILFFLPTFSATFTNAPLGGVPVAKVEEPAKPAEPVAKVAAKVEEPAKPAEPVAKVEEPVKPAEPVAKVEEPAKPAEPVAKVDAKVEEPAKPAEPAKPMAEEPAKPAEAVAKTKSDADKKLDYVALNARPIFWPPSVLVTTATSTPLMEKGKKVADIPLEVGAVLQLSKVLGDGTLEVRAQGLKFEIDGKLTDFDDGVRRKIADLAEKGSTIPPPYKTDKPYIPPIVPLPTAPPPAVKTPDPAPATPTERPAVPAPTTTKPTPRPRDNLDDKMNSLFGRRATPEEAAEAKKKSSPAK
jgi:hypothetical protein